MVFIFIAFSVSLGIDRLVRGGPGVRAAISKARRHPCAS
jgi:hypothetical protein